MIKQWAGYVFCGKLPFQLTTGERVFFGALQAVDCLLVAYAAGLVH